MIKKPYTLSQKIVVSEIPRTFIAIWFLLSFPLLHSKHSDVHESLFAVLEGNEIPKAPTLNYMEDEARWQNSTS